VKKSETTTTTLRYAHPLPAGHQFADPAVLLAYLDRCEAAAKRADPEDDEEECATCPIR